MAIGTYPHLCKLGQGHSAGPPKFTSSQQHPRLLVWHSKLTLSHSTRLTTQHDARQLGKTWRGLE